MKLSTRARYALRLMVAVSQLTEDGRWVSLDKVSRATRLPRRYLEQLALALRNAGLLLSAAGRNGGYVLSRAPEEISIGQIVEAAIGPINIVECARHPETCIQAEFCECWGLYALINSRIQEVFNEHSLADLTEKKWLRQIRREAGELLNSEQARTLARAGKQWTTPHRAATGT